MQPVNEADDVERLLDVLGVPGLPYQSFRKPVDACQSGPAGTASTRVETSFPLLAAALPELAGVVVPCPMDIKQPEPAAEWPRQDKSDNTVPLDGEPSAAPVPPPAIPVAARTAPATSAGPVVRKPVTVPPVPTAQAPRSPAETPIRDVFNILRGTVVRRETETTSQRGIRMLFNRP